MNTLHYVRAIVVKNWMQKAVNKINSLKLWQNERALANREQQIKVDFGSGTLADGFSSVTIQWFDLDRSFPAQKTVSLSKAPDIDLLMQKWRILYRAINEVFRNGIELDFKTPTNVSVVDLDELGAQLKAVIDRWLFPLERELLFLFQTISRSRIILVTDDEQLQKIPWHLWRLFESQNCIEYALSASSYEHKHQSSTPKGKVRILAVFGNSDDLDLESDRKSLQSLPNAEVHILENPRKTELDETLRDNLGWDILFFAGHSNTKNHLGILRINDDDVLNTDRLTSCLKAATKNGTQLAIFNSCDGIGLAHALEGVGFSHVIVMSEPIPDPVAQSFITFWLSEFARGQSFYSTTRQAREKLKILEDDYPCASWLPAIFQNPTAEAPTWQNLKAISPFSWRIPLAVGIAVGALITGIRATGILQIPEFKTYDAFMSWRKDEATDPRILIVTGQDEQRFGFPFSDEVIAETIEKIDEYQPRVIGLDIFRNPSQKDDSNRLKQAFLNIPIVSGVCELGKAEQSENSPSPPLSSERMGFSNIPYDLDNVLRRVSLFHTPSSNDQCRADNYLGTKLALDYLKKDSILPQTTSKGIVQIGAQKYHPLPNYAGAYQKKGYEGYEMFINYRMGNSFQTVSIADVIDGKVDPELVRDRIVIIGMDIPDQDRHTIPLQDDVPGVEIIAHVSSQILANVLDKRLLIWILPLGVEIVLILASSVAGSLFAEAEKSYGDRKIIWIVYGLGLIVLPGCCWFVLAFYGGWIPVIPLGLGFFGGYGATLSFDNRRLKTDF